MELFSAGKNTIGTPNLLEKFLLVARYLMLDTRYWILDTRYWILDTGYWILDTRSGFCLFVAQITSI